MGLFRLMGYVWILFASIMIIMADQIAVPARMIIPLIVFDAVVASIGVLLISVLARLVRFDEPLPRFMWTWSMLVTPFILNDLYITGLSLYPGLLSWSPTIKAMSIALTIFVALFAMLQQASLAAQQRGA